MNTPCKDCLTRHPGCHGSCWKYRDYREEWDRLKERERQRVGVYRPPRGGYKNLMFIPHRIKGDQ